MESSNGLPFREYVLPYKKQISQVLMGARFLGSEIVELCTSTGPETLKIHEKLLASKCKGPSVALKHDFA